MKKKEYIGNIGPMGALHFNLRQLSTHEFRHSWLINESRKYQPIAAKSLLQLTNQINTSRLLISTVYHENVDSTNRVQSQGMFFEQCLRSNFWIRIFMVSPCLSAINIRQSPSRQVSSCFGFVWTSAISFQLVGIMERFSKPWTHLDNFQTNLRIKRCFVWIGY